MPAAVPAAVLQRLRAPVRGHVWLVGHGHVASHAASWLHGRGWTSTHIGARGLAAGTEELPGMSSKTAASGPISRVPKAIWLLCQDPQLGVVATAIAGCGLRPVPVLHAAGSLPARDALAPLVAAGFPVGTLHPICSLRREVECSWLDRCSFGVEGDEPARVMALRLIEDQPWIDLQNLESHARTRYHAACALAANHLSVLLAEAADTLVSVTGSQPRAVIDQALAVLMRPALHNQLALDVLTGAHHGGRARAAIEHEDLVLLGELLDRGEQVIGVAAVVLGEDFLPENVDFNIIDHFEKVTDKDAAIAARRLAKEEGILLGYSAGSALAGVHQLKDQLKPDDVVVILFHDHGSRYVGKLYNDDWMRERGFLDTELKVRDLILNKRDKKFIAVTATDSVKHVLHMMKDLDISQLLVTKDEVIVGSVTESNILEFILTNPLHNSKKHVSEIMAAPFPKVSIDLPVKDLNKYISKNTPAVIAEDRSGDLIVLTQYDIIQAL